MFNFAGFQQKKKKKSMKDLWLYSLGGYKLAIKNKQKVEKIANFLKKNKIDRLKQKNKWKENKLVCAFDFV